MYELTDNMVSYLNKRFIEAFGKLKTVFSFDELNVLQATKNLYSELNAIVKEAFYLLAVSVYEQYAGGDNGSITEDWLDEILNSYDPITKYVYEHEVERKCARLAESIIASATENAEIDTGLRLWSSMITQYAIEITDKAVLQAYIDTDIEKVRWVSHEDNRRCKICKKRHGRIYDIYELPPKPHIGCRCWFEAVAEV